MLIPIIIALFIAGGTSIAAENALPGEFLYPIKVDVNEKVFDLVSVTSKAQAAADLGHAQERLQEAEKLAAGKHLDTKTSADINTRLEAHIKDLNKQATQMEASQDATEALTLHSDLEASLKAHDRILASIKGEDQGEQAAIDSIRSVVGGEASSTEQDRVDAEAQVSADQGGGVKSAAEGKLKAAENKIAEVRSFIEKKQSQGLEAHPPTAKEEAQIKLADDAVAAGKVKLEAGVYGAAFNDFQRAIRIAQGAKIIVEAKIGEFEFDIYDIAGGDEGDMSNASTTENGGGDERKGGELHNGDKNGEQGSREDIRGFLRIRSTSTPAFRGGEDGAETEGGDGGSDDGIEGGGPIQVNVKL